MPKPRELSQEFRDEFVVTIGGKNGKEAVLYNGLLALAHEDERFGHIRAYVTQYPNKENGERCFARAEIYDKEGRLIGMEEADATPQNCGKMTAASFPRMACTRAKARALRDFLNIGMVCAEEVHMAWEPEKASPKQIGTIKRLGKKYKISKQEMYEILEEEGGVTEFNELTPEGADAVIKYLENYEAEEGSDEEEFQM